MVVTSPVWVNPVYGWGWTDGNAIADTPDRFLAFVTRDADELVGVIQSGDLKNQKIKMSRRHTGPFDGHVNVKVQNGNLDGELFGYAEISRDLME